jgi:ribosomal protein S18 acetylase RimI-like enzyme
VTSDDTAPPDSVVLRAATADDVTEVLALWAAAGAHPGTTDDAPSVAALVAHHPGALLVAEIDGRMVGTLIAAWDGWRGNMYRLAVLPRARRRGIATSLVREGERRMRGAGCRRVTALVVESDVHAVGFWTHMDYLPYPMARYVHTLVAGP